MIYLSKTSSPEHNFKKFYSPKIEKQNLKKVNTKLLNPISIPDKKVSKKYFILFMSISYILL